MLILTNINQLYSNYIINIFEGIHNILWMYFRYRYHTEAQVAQYNKWKTFNVYNHVCVFKLFSTSIKYSTYWYICIIFLESIGFENIERKCIYLKRHLIILLIIKICIIRFMQNRISLTFKRLNCPYLL